MNKETVKKGFVVLFLTTSGTVIVFLSKNECNMVTY